jgi:hypothetical protein
MVQAGTTLLRQVIGVAQSYYTEEIRVNVFRHRPNLFRSPEVSCLKLSVSQHSWDTSVRMVRHGYLWNRAKMRVLAAAGKLPEPDQ